jgi:hypothetical protein
VADSLDDASDINERPREERGRERERERERGERGES